MKNERFQLLMSILLVPVLLLGMVAFCKLEVETAQENGTWHYQDWDIEEAVAEETLEEQGYTAYQQLPERMKKLQAVFLNAQSEEQRDGGEEYDEDEYDGDEYELTVDNMGSDEYLKHESSRLIQFNDKSVFLAAELGYDPAKHCFVAEELAEIEACGFPGFTEKMQQIAGKIAGKIAESIEETVFVENAEIYLYCQGVEFKVIRTGKTSVDLHAYIGALTCYAPEKYKEFIQKVTAEGKYFLYSTCVGGGTEVITFCKNDSISYEAEQSYKDGEKKGDNKKIVCLFRNGKLDDYYVVACGGELELDEADQAFLDTYTKGLGKELSEKPSMVSKWQGVHRIYRTK